MKKLYLGPLSLLWLAACTASGEAGSAAGDMGALPPGLSDTDALAVCTTMNEATCDRLSECAPMGLATAWGTLALCKERAIAGCQLALTRPGVRVSQAEADACAAAHHAQACDNPHDLAVCQFKGMLEQGQPCGIHNQCKSSWCSTEENGSCGACLTVAADGAACTTGVSTCAAGSSCEDDVCKKLAAEGATCAHSYDCGEWLSCDEASLKCVPAGQAAGQACDGFDCNLRAGLVCSSGCRTIATLAAPGEACGDDASSETTATMCDNGVCDGTSDTCLPRVATGEPCGAQAICQYGLACASGVCASGPSGGACL